MKKWLTTLLIIALLATAGYFGYQRIAARRSAAEAPSLETALVQRGDLSITIEATGSLLPPAQYTLAFSTGGEIVEILVAEGQTVNEGDLLARLDDAKLHLNLEQAELNLQSLTSPYAIAEAEKALADAIEVLEDAEYTNWAQQKDNRGAASTIESLEADLILAEDKVEDKQDKFDELADKPEDNYERAVALSELSVAIEARDAIIRQLNWYLGAPGETDQQILDADVTVAEARVLAAEALLAELRGEPLPLEDETYLSPELTQIREARLAVESASLALTETRLEAPVDGVVTMLPVHVGEFANPGAPVIELTDLTALEAEVNLDETDMVHIAVGTPVAITVDAFPGTELSGAVTEIALSPDIQSGVVLYSVSVRLDPTGLPLRSGMTVNVTFPIEERTDTLTVPFRAVETEGGQAYVTRVTDASSERVAVMLGLITDTQIEILDGLNEGDVVAVFANPVQDTEIMKNPIFGGGN